VQYLATPLYLETPLEKPLLFLQFFLIKKKATVNLCKINLADIYERNNA
jgi:hypothetical protein